MSDESRRTDLLGREPGAVELELLFVYESLKDLLADPCLSPCVAANARSALAHIAVAVTDLGLEFEHLADLGV
jgi:hypothetical protein